MKSNEAQLGVQARSALPTHVAIIMDGNGRWAKERNLPRIEGHRNGVESVRNVVRTTGELGINFLTLYAFSVENWNRPKQEVDTLMSLLSQFLKSELSELKKNNIRLEIIGQVYRLPEHVQAQLKKTQAALAGNNGLTLILALSYGGRTEILDAVRTIASEVKDGLLEPEEINEQVFSQHLYTRQWPDPDLLIRTSGEMRISNFLLWQISYAELVVTPVFWPDFNKKEYFEALEEYARRHRRFGGL